MTENEIVAILNRELRASSGYIGGEIVSRRRKSLEYIQVNLLVMNKKEDLKS